MESLVSGIAGGIIGGFFVMFFLNRFRIDNSLPAAPLPSFRPFSRQSTNLTKPKVKDDADAVKFEAKHKR
jgi:hypothetical protein